MFSLIGLAVFIVFARLALRRAIISFLEFKTLYRRRLDTLKNNHPILPN